MSDPTTSPPMTHQNKEGLEASAVAFLLEMANYFERRPTNGEDMAFWANVTNKRNCEGIASLVSSLREENERLRKERDEAKREARDKDIHYRTWKEFYGALLAVPPNDAIPLEVRVHRQANIISDMQYRIRNLRREIRRHLKEDTLVPRWLPKSMAMKLRITQDRLVKERLTSRAETAETALSASQAQLKIYREALEPFADFGELLELETEGFSDTDRLELVPEESDVRIGDLFVGAFRRARTALSSTDKGQGNG